MNRIADIDELAPRGRSLRVAMVTETYPPEVNGVARTIGLMAEGLRARGHAIQLVRPRQHRDDRGVQEAEFEELLRPGIPVPRYTQLKMGAPGARALERAWRRWRPDLVHVATEGPLGWSALSAARGLKLPVVADFHTNFHAYSKHYGISWLRRPIEGYLRHFHNRADCTLVPTAELAAQLGARGFERLRVVGRGVSPEVFSPARRSRALRASWGAGDDTLVALCVSRFAPEKNFPLVIEAYQAMRRRRPDTKLVLVGDGPLLEKLRRARIGCVIAGRLVNGELSTHYASGDVFLFPSITETFGNVTLEAMASGLGVVAYDYAAARQHLEHGRSALLAPYDDRAAFIAQAERMASEPQLARQLGCAARAVSEGVTWSHIVRDFEAALFEAGAGRRPAAEAEPVAL
ncbi:MAG TPA: glycosyltransferase family 1 protein [Burkholderiales bacterium]|nr:glycosyltransferase family 1 protein [Burkholderiales bacterium]